MRSMRPMSSSCPAGVLPAWPNQEAPESMASAAHAASPSSPSTSGPALRCWERRTLRTRPPVTEELFPSVGCIILLFCLGTGELIEGKSPHPS